MARGQSHKATFISGLASTNYLPLRMFIRKCSLCTARSLRHPRHDNSVFNKWVSPTVLDFRYTGFIASTKLDT